MLARTVLSALAALLALLVPIGLLVDSFLLDPFILFVSAFAHRLIQDLALRRRWVGTRYVPTIAVLTLALFFAISVSLYFNLDWVAWLARDCGAASGRDWMINSGVFRFDAVEPGALTHAIAVVLFLFYPLWYLLGDRTGIALASRVTRPSPA